MMREGRYCYKRHVKIYPLLFIEPIPGEQDSHCCCLVAQLCPTLYDPMDCSPPGSSPPPHGIFQAKNSGVDGHFFLQGIFPVQESNAHLLHWKVDSLPLSHQGSPHVDILLKHNFSKKCFYRYFVDILRVVAMYRALQALPKWHSGKEYTC